MSPEIDKPLSDKINDLTQIEQLLKNWLIGSDTSPTLEDFPTAWHPFLASNLKSKNPKLEATKDRNDLSLISLGLMGHQQSILNTPLPSEEIRPLAPIPSINTPLLNLYSNQAYRLIIRLISQDSEYLLQALTLITKHGYALPPTDYFRFISKCNLYRHNQVNDSNISAVNIHHEITKQVLNIYQPWYIYLQDKTGVLNLEKDTITIENWAEYTPSYRVQLLTNLRLDNPDACVELLAECLNKEPAETRVRTIQVLENKLNDNDKDYLISLLTDRSKKVIAIAQQYLMRLGEFNSLKKLDKSRNKKTDEINEYVEFIKNNIEISEIKKKNINSPIESRLQIKLTSIKDRKKREKRRTILTKYPLPVLAQIISTDEFPINVETLIHGWAFDKHPSQDNRTFLEHASNLPEQYISDVATILSHYTPSHPDEILPIWYRLDTKKQQQLILQYLTNPKIDWRFYRYLDFAPISLTDGSLTLTDIINSRAWVALIESAKKQSYVFANDCIVLGLILPTGLAQKILDKLNQEIKKNDQYFGSTDPIFDGLRLNIELSSLPDS